MMISVDIYAQRILQISKNNGASNVRVFGSMARGTANSSSDLDLLIDLEPGKDLLDLIGIKQEIEDSTGLKVDILTEKGISKHLRDVILKEARPL